MVVLRASAYRLVPTERSAILLRMKRTPIIAFVLVIMTLGAQANSHGPTSLGSIVWLGGIADQDKAIWQGKGFSIIEPLCADADPSGCLSQTFTGLDYANPVYLVARAEHTALVQDLYKFGIGAPMPQGVILMRTDGANLNPVFTRADAPNLLVLTEQSDSANVIAGSRRLASAFRNQGVDAAFFIVEDGMLQNAGMHPMAMDVILHFMGHSPETAQLKMLLDAYAAWQLPPWNNQDFLQRADLLATYPMNPSLYRMFEFHFKFGPHRHLIKQWRFETYLAFDLLTYVKEKDPNARYVTLRNRFGQVYYLDLEWYGAFDPVIVVGIDDEINMNRFVYFYRTRAMYSWYWGTPNVSAQPMGAFLFFRKDLPDDLLIPTHLISALALDGIELSDTDPLAPIANYPADVRMVITKNNKCLFCHRIGNLGGRAHHIDAITGLTQGGIALPLVNYPDAVIKAFIFDQENAANRIGMTPNYLNPRLVSPFYDWVRQLSQ